MGNPPPAGTDRPHRHGLTRPESPSAAGAAAALVLGPGPGGGGVHTERGVGVPADPRQATRISS